LDIISQSTAEKEKLGGVPGERNPRVFRRLVESEGNGGKKAMFDKRQYGVKKGLAKECVRRKKRSSLGKGTQFLLRDFRGGKMTTNCKT